MSFCCVNIAVIVLMTTTVAVMASSSSSSSTTPMMNVSIPIISNEYLPMEKKKKKNFLFQKRTTDDREEDEYTTTSSSSNNLRVLPQPPPYYGTIFVEPNIITSNDRTMYEGYTYEGMGKRTIYDRRVPGWVFNTNVHLYEVTYYDQRQIEFAVHNEFTKNKANQEVQYYATELGRMPSMLLNGVDQVWIMKGNNGWGGGPAWSYDGVLNHVLIHTGMGEGYKNSGIVVEVFIHEAVHAVLDRTIYNDADWYQAADDDGKYISTYARDYPNREDVAETLLLYLAVEYKKDRLDTYDYDTIMNTIPNRIQYLNSLNYNVSPLDDDEQFTISPTTKTKTPTSSPSPPANNCEDSKLFFLINNKRRRCGWVRSGNSKEKCSRGNGAVATHCPKTCGTCSACVDARKKFVWRNGTLKQCKWVASKNTKKRCNNIGDMFTCRATCGNC